MPCHIIHVAVATAREPVEQARFGLREIAVRDADPLKTELSAPALYIRRKRGKVRNGCAVDHFFFHHPIRSS